MDYVVEEGSLEMEDEGGTPRWEWMAKYPERKPARENPLITRGALLRCMQLLSLLEGGKEIESYD